MLIEQTYRSELTSLSQSQNDHIINQTIQNHSLDNIALIFWSTASIIGRCAHLSRQWDSEFDVFCSQARATYKCKADKVQSVESSRSQQRMFNSCNKLKREDPQRKASIDSAARTKSRFIWSFNYSDSEVFWHQVRH